MSAEFYFSKGNITFTKLNIQLGEIDIQFNSIIYKALYKILKGLIVKYVNSKIPDVKTDIQQTINNVIFSQHEMALALGLGVNLTNIERPVLDFEKINQLRYGSNSDDMFSNSIFGTKVVDKIVKAFMVKYLRGANMRDSINDIKEESTVNVETDTFLTFGIEGTLYQTRDPSEKPAVPPAPRMNFMGGAWNDKLKLLLSDYTINSLLYVAQLSGQLAYKLTNDTKPDILPFNITTKGISIIAPEFEKKFKTEFPMEIKLFIKAVDMPQPIISTSIKGSKVTATFGMDFYVKNSTDIWDDPVKELALEGIVEIEMVPHITNDLVTLLIPSSSITHLNVVKSDFDAFDAIRCLNNLENLLDVAVDQFKPKLRDIDVLSKITKYLPGLKLSDLKIDPSLGYLSISLDAAKK